MPTQMLIPEITIGVTIGLFTISLLLPLKHFEGDNFKNVFGHPGSTLTPPKYLDLTAWNVQMPKTNGHSASLSNFKSTYKPDPNATDATAELYESYIAMMLQEGTVTTCGEIRKPADGSKYHKQMSGVAVWVTVVSVLLAIVLLVAVLAGYVYNMTSVVGIPVIWLLVAAGVFGAAGALAGVGFVARNTKLGSQVSDKANTKCDDQGSSDSTNIASLLTIDTGKIGIGSMALIAAGVLSLVIIPLSKKYPA